MRTFCQKMGKNDYVAKIQDNDVQFINIRLYTKVYQKILTSLKNEDGLVEKVFYKQVGGQRDTISLVKH